MASKVTYIAKLVSATSPPMTTREFIAQGKYVMSQVDPLSKNYAFLVHSYVASGTAALLAALCAGAPPWCAPFLSGAGVNL